MGTKIILMNVCATKKGINEKEKDKKYVVLMSLISSTKVRLDNC